MSNVDDVKDTLLKIIRSQHVNGFAPTISFLQACMMVDSRVFYAALNLLFVKVPLLQKEERLYKLKDFSIKAVKVITSKYFDSSLLITKHYETSVFDDELATNSNELQIKQPDYATVKPTVAAPKINPFSNGVYTPKRTVNIRTGYVITV